MKYIYDGPITIPSAIYFHILACDLLDPPFSRGYNVLAYIVHWAQAHCIYRA